MNTVTNATPASSTAPTTSAAPATQKITLEVDGMTCHSCVRHVQGALSELDGVCSVEVRFREGKVLVEHEGTEPSAMIEALREAGYESRASL